MAVDPAHGVAPAHLAPERVMGAPGGPASDTYVLATIAYELLAGAPPFAGDDLELLYAHVHREPPAASGRNPELSPAVDAALARGLAKDPAERWENGAALVAALRAALRSEREAEAEPAAARPPPPSRLAGWLAGPRRLWGR
jgi:serine/threonine protein kinase